MDERDAEGQEDDGEDHEGEQINSGTREAGAIGGGAGGGHHRGHCAGGGDDEVNLDAVRLHLRYLS